MSQAAPLDPDSERGRDVEDRLNALLTDVVLKRRRRERAKQQQAA